MAFFGASSLINAGIGGAIGGGMAMANGYDTAGILGGAVAGGAFGVLGGGRLGNWAGRKIRRGLVGGMSAGQNYLAKASLGLEGNTLKAANFGVKQIGRGIDKLHSKGAAIGINKWGSRAATLAGLGAASYIGSSMIGSNSGY